MIPAHKRLQSFAEEVANGISHGIALVGCLIATPFLIDSALRPGDAWNVVGAAIFAGAMIFLYLSSTLYHVIPESKAKRVFRVLDHVAIFLLIAGTYTPFTLGVLRGPWGWTLFSIVWSLAVLGATLKITGALWHPRLSTGLYLAMGPLPGILLLLAGGVAYAAGLAFYGAERKRYSHFVWHLFVVLGTTCHFFASLWYAGHL